MKKCYQLLVLSVSWGVIVFCIGCDIGIGLNPKSPPEIPGAPTWYKNDPADATSTNMQGSFTSATREILNYDSSKIVSYGKNVYYFPYVGANIANALVEFLNQHPMLEWVGEFHDVVRLNCYNLDRRGSSQDYGGTTGHFMVFREKK